MSGTSRFRLTRPDVMSTPDTSICSVQPEACRTRCCRPSGSIRTVRSAGRVDKSVPGRSGVEARAVARNTGMPACGSQMKCAW